MSSLDSRTYGPGLKATYIYHMHMQDRGPKLQVQTAKVESKLGTVCSVHIGHV